MILVFSVVMMMNVAVNGEEEGERNAEERTAVREDEKQEHEEDRFDLRRGRARPHRASTRPATVSCVLHTCNGRAAAASKRSGV